MTTEEVIGVYREFLPGRNKRPSYLKQIKLVDGVIWVISSDCVCWRIYRVDDSPIKEYIIQREQHE